MNVKDVISDQVVLFKFPKIKIDVFIKFYRHCMERFKFRFLHAIMHNYSVNENIVKEVRKIKEVTSLSRPRL